MLIAGLNDGKVPPTAASNVEILRAFWKRWAQFVFEQWSILLGRVFHLGRSHGCCPVRAKGSSRPCGRCLLAPLTGNKEGSMERMALRVRHTPTRFPISILSTYSIANSEIMGQVL